MVDGPDAVMEAELEPELLRSAAAAKEWLKQQSANAPAISIEEVEVVAAAHPEDLDVQHRVGNVLSLAGAHDKALPYLERALLLRPSFHYTELEIALVHARAGRPDLAREWFDIATRSRPDYAITYLQAARYELAQNRPPVALAHFQSALALEPANTATIREVFRILANAGQMVRALDVLRGGHRNGALDENLQIELVRLLGQLGLYNELIAHGALLSPRPGSALATHVNVETGQATMARAYALDPFVTRAALRERSDRWLAAPALARRLRAAIEQATPTSFVRHGDGEGRFLAQADPDLPYALSPAQRCSIRDVIWFNWFGVAPDDEQLARMDDLIRRVRRTIETADILGISSARRLARDRGHFGYLAYLDALAEQTSRQRPDQMLTDAMVHTDLHEQDPFLRQMLAGVSWLGVLSPHPALGARLRRNLGIAAGQDFNIPGEMRLPDDPGLVRGRGHFPARYDELMATLHVPFRGAVVLVAGGLLGKIYCERIRDCGGIAIDIGSLADAWMGYATRPGQFRKPELWRLPI
jgi:tetratricopeptide (TPR) repeat protein